MNNEFINIAKAAHTNYKIEYHFVWVTKYRYLYRCSRNRMLPVAVGNCFAMPAVVQPARAFFRGVLNVSVAREGLE